MSHDNSNNIAEAEERKRREFERDVVNRLAAMQAALHDAVWRLKQIERPQYGRLVQRGALGRAAFPHPGPRKASADTLGDDAALELGELA